MKSKKEILLRIKSSRLAYDPDLLFFQKKIEEEVASEIDAAGEELETNKELLSGLEGLSKLLVSFS